MQLGSGGQADAADVTAMPASDAIKVPEFVPVVNFSQFVLAIRGREPELRASGCGTAERQVYREFRAAEDRTSSGSRRHRDTACHDRERSG